MLFGSPVSRFFTFDLGQNRRKKIMVTSPEKKHDIYRGQLAPFALWRWLHPTGLSKGSSRHRRRRPPAKAGEKKRVSGTLRWLLRTEARVRCSDCGGSDGGGGNDDGLKWSAVREHRGAASESTSSLPES
jgi:hypothetical protein